MIHRILLVTVLAWLALSASAFAQVDRYELGLRVRAFERAWDQTPDSKARQRTADPLIRATTSFFTFRLADAGRSLDQARWSLAGKDAPTPALQWAESLRVLPDARLVDVGEGILEVKLDAFYNVDAPIPARARAELRLVSTDEKVRVASASVPIDKVPLTVKLPWKEAQPGDYHLRASIHADGVESKRVEQTISLARDLNKRWAALRMRVKALPAATLATTDGQTILERELLLGQLNAKKTLETNYPANRLLREAEEAVEAVKAGERYYGMPRLGQDWLKLALPKTKVIVRLQAPPGLKKEAPVPLLLALHGAGGSENMFFDSYGDGAIARLCQQRGWLLVAPRSGVFFSNPLPEIVDEVARLYPVDGKRVFLVGHSMGAMQAVAAVQQTPQRFAGVAALGGGGRLVQGVAIQKVPFFVGVGGRDFALGGARQLRDALKKADVERVQYREYADIEHLVVVQQALPEVFAFFDGIGKR